MVKNAPPDPEDVSAAFDKAVRILNAASQTTAGLTQKLLRRGYSQAAALAACQRAVEMGYVNDAAYAEALVGRRLRQGRGVRLIGRELGHKGIDPDLVATAVAAVDPDDEYDSALDLAMRLVRRQAAASDPARGRDRALAAMARRGFASGIARRALAEATLRLAEPA